jgi:hypothetical protein
MSVGQVALAAGQVLLIVFGSLINDYAVYAIASHVSRQHQIHTGKLVPILEGRRSTKRHRPMAVMPVMIIVIIIILPTDCRFWDAHQGPHHRLCVHDSLQPEVRSLAERRAGSDKRRNSCGRD